MFFLSTISILTIKVLFLIINKLMNIVNSISLLYSILLSKEKNHSVFKN